MFVEHEGENSDPEGFSVQSLDDYLGADFCWTKWT